MKDIDSPMVNKFKSKRTGNPLEPVYTLETKSRRHVLQVGTVDGSKPANTKSTITRRYTNNVDDIHGTKPKDRFSVPQNYISNSP